MKNKSLTRLIKSLKSHAFGFLVIFLLTGCAASPSRVLSAVPDMNAGQSETSTGSGGTGVEIIGKDLLIIVEAPRNRSYQDLVLGNYGTVLDVLVVNASENRSMTVDPKKIRITIDDRPVALMTKADIDRKAASEKAGEGFMNALLLGTAVMAGAYAADAASYGADPVAVAQLGDAAANMAAYSISNQLSAAEQANQIAKAHGEHFHKVALERKIIGPGESHGGFIVAKSKSVKIELLVEIEIDNQIFTAIFHAW